MILAKLNNVVLQGMNGWRLKKMGVVNHSMKWCVVPGLTGPSGPEGAVSSDPGGRKNPGATGATGAVISGSGGTEG